MIKVYGIKNCDTVKKALKALNEQGLEYDFYDFKKYDPKKADISRWEKFLGEIPVNKRGTTFRKIKESFEDASKSEKVQLLIENSSAIKRPVIEKGGSVVCIGFDPAAIKGL